MKKILLAAGFILASVTLTFANDTTIRKQRQGGKNEKKENKKENRDAKRSENRTVVSDLTKAHFAADFPDAKAPVFSKTPNFEEVSFMQGKKQVKAYYDAESTLVGTTQKKTLADLPEDARKEILKLYPGYTVSSVIKFDDNEANETDMIIFDTPTEDEDNFFVELKNGSNDKIVKVSPSGSVSFFKDMK